MASQKIIVTISIILGILLTIIGILAFFKINTIDDLIPNGVNTSPPLTISIEPSFIEEGQYTDFNNIPQQIVIKFTLTVNPDKNITYIELNQNSVIIDRKDKTSQTKVSSIYWTDIADNSHVFYYAPYSSYYYPISKSLEAEGKLWGCQNCFMGEDHPYTFTFNFIYAESDNYKKPYSVTIELPIR